MCDIKKLKVIDRENGYNGSNIIFKTIRTNNEHTKIAIVGIEGRESYYASLYILLPNEVLIDACRFFVEDDDVLYTNEKLEYCIQGSDHYAGCDFVNIENSVYLCFHTWLGEWSERSSTSKTEKYFNIIADTYDDVVSAILDVFNTYRLKQLDKKKVECFDEILQQVQQTPISLSFTGVSICEKYVDYFKQLYEIEKHLKDIFKLKANKAQYQKILYDRKKYKVS